MFNCILFNARSLENKIDLLPLVFKEYDPSLVFVVETWLKPHIPDALLCMQNVFSISRHDRTNAMGGGVCIFIKNGINYNDVNIDEKYDDVEMHAIDVTMSDKTVRYIVCYRPPYYDDKAKNYANKLIECLNSLIKCAWTSVIVGDFNLPLIDWSSNCSPLSCIYLEFFDFVSTNGFIQVVDSPTRDENILDLVLCNSQLLINDCNVVAPVGESDHNTVVFNITGEVSNNSVDVTAPFVAVKDFKSADYLSLNNYLSGIDWQRILANIHDIQVMWIVFTSILDGAIDMFVPTRNVKLDHRTDLRSYPKHIKRLFSQKLSAWRIYRQFRTDALKEKYKAKSRKCQNAIALFVRNKESSIVNSGNVGDFYRYVNDKISNRSGIAALKNENGDFLTDDLSKAERLNEFFGSVFTKDNNVIEEPSNLNTVGVSGNNAIIDDVDFSVSDIYNILRGLKSKFSCGPDGYCAYFLKNIASPLSFPLSLLFSQSFVSGDIPNIWRQAIVTPVFKKGKPCEPNNYRPISLTCVCCKVMEAVIKKQVIDFLLLHNKICKQQHGFLAKHSTCSQLIECVNDWTVALNTKKHADVIYIDFSKAFDSVVHKKLIFKLDCLGIKGKLLHWISAFLTLRTQVVKVGICLSDNVAVISGVPQGSVLGPLLFLVYINDIVNIFDDAVEVKLFADDVKIYIVIDDVSDCFSLQICLDRLIVWANNWQLNVSVAKCARLHVSNNNNNRPNRTDVKNFQYHLDSFELPDVKCITDLGICISNNLKFRTHINNIVSKAHQRASLILRCFKCRDPNILLKAFLVYVRPLVEYCSQVWSPISLTDINKLERVQRRFTSRLRGMQGLPYCDRLSKLNLQTLELRRLLADVIFVFKVIKGVIIVDRNIFEFAHVSSLRGHSLKLVKPLAVINSRKSFFSCRIIDIWNCLPDSTVELNSVLLFKNAINHFNFEKFLHI